MDRDGSHLLRKWLLRFLKPECIEGKAPWTVDYKSPDNRLPGLRMIMGDANAAISALTQLDQEKFIKRAVNFFMEATHRLLKYLPFDNAHLRSLQFLDTNRASNSNLSRWTKFLAKALPSVISPQQLDDLQVTSHFRILLTIETVMLSFIARWKRLCTQFHTQAPRVLLLMSIGRLSKKMDVFPCCAN
jgi:hypothetical protein